MVNENTNYDTMLGKMAVEQGLCTGEELKRCAEEAQAQQETSAVLLQDMLIKKGFITATQAQRLKNSIR